MLSRRTRFAKRFGFSQGSSRREFEIVGVVTNVVIDVDRSRIRPNYYTPEALNGAGTSFVVRIAGNPQDVVPEIRRAVADVDPNFW